MRAAVRGFRGLRRAWDGLGKTAVSGRRAKSVIAERRLIGVWEFDNDMRGT